MLQKLRQSQVFGFGFYSSRIIVNIPLHANIIIFIKIRNVQNHPVQFSTRPIKSFLEIMK